MRTCLNVVPHVVELPPVLLLVGPADVCRVEVLEVLVQHVPCLVRVHLGSLWIHQETLLDLFIVSVHIRDGVLEANEDTAGDADDEDQTEDDEGGNYN